MRTILLASALLAGVASGMTLRAIKQKPISDSACAPEQFWIHYREDPQEMAISWATSCTSDSLVNYGTNQNSLSLSTSGNSTTYSAFGYNSPYLHHVILSNLSPDTLYYYQVGSTQSGFSTVMNFTSHPGVGLQTGPLLFGVIGDLGQTPNSVDTLAHIASNANNIRSIIHVGDLSYADEYEPRWDTFQRMTSYMSSYIPWNTVVGNHEMEFIAGPLAYQTRWKLMPNNDQGKLYYSFNVGPVHWIMLSSYSPFDSSSDQYSWLSNDLATIDRTVTPWVFAVIHAPWYNSNHAHHGEGETMRESLEPMLFAANIDAVFAGHVHAYERNTRVYNQTANPFGPYHITIGDGGNREGLATGWYAQPNYSMFRQSSYGHGELMVYNATHSLWTWHQNPDLEPTIADELWIVKSQVDNVQLGTGEVIFKTEEAKRWNDKVTAEAKLAASSKKHH